MSSVFPKGERLYFSLKVDGVWKSIPTDFKVGQERAAKSALAKIDARRAAGAELAGDSGPVTVAKFYAQWIATREREGVVRTWKNDETIMRLHVLPVLGRRLLDEVRTLHIIDLVAALRARKGDDSLAPKTIYSIYSTLSALFRDARRCSGLVQATLLGR